MSNWNFAVLLRNSRDRSSAHTCQCDTSHASLAHTKQQSFDSILPFRWITAMTGVNVVNGSAVVFIDKSVTSYSESLSLRAAALALALAGEMIWELLVSMTHCLSKNLSNLPLHAGTRVFWWTSNGECQYAAVESSSRLSDVRYYNLLMVPGSYRRIFVIQGTQVLVLKLDGKPETATLLCAPSYFRFLSSNISKLQSSICHQSNLS